MSVGRNDPCPCGSGKKYKKCCGSAEKSAVGAATARYERALGACATGSTNEALKELRGLLNAFPDHAAASHLAGALSFERGDPQAARNYLTKAVMLAPREAQWHSDLAHVLSSMSDHEAAIHHARIAVELDASLSDGHNHLGNALLAVGKLEEAERHYRAAVAQNPNDPWFQLNLAVCLQQRNGLEEAEQLYRKVIQLSPQDSTAYANLGSLYLQRRRPEEARAVLYRAVELHPKDVSALNNLGIALLELRRAAGARGLFERVLVLDPEFQGARANLLKALSAAGELSDAHLQHKDTLPTVLRALQSNCSFVRRNEVANLLSSSIVAGRELSAQSSESALLALSYEDLPENLLLNCHRAWASSVQSEIGATAPLAGEPKIRHGRHKIRVGYLSPDFRQHAMAFFVAPIIENHDRSSFEIYCYYTMSKFDDWTRSIESHADHFICVHTLDDHQLAQRIRDDGIDILVDLAGHTFGNRLGAFVYRPAPVQATYLGYPNTTGLDAVDYLLADRFTSLASEGLGPEELLVLPEGLLTYPKSAIFTRAVRPPCLERGHVTFGSLNNLSKISETSIRMWASVMQRVPGARLLVAYDGADTDVVQANLCRVFEQQGIAKQRLSFAGRRPRSEFVKLYNEVDVMLDTYPYTGTTTTCEALWMGVPVITRSGTSIRSRVTGSILKVIGAEHLIAQTEEQYVERAVALARDLDSLASLRLELPERMRQSEVGQPDRFTRNLESAYRSALGSESCTKVES